MSVNTVIVYFGSLGENTSISDSGTVSMHARADAAAAVLGKIGVGVEVDHVAEDGVAAVARDVADLRAARDFVDAVDRRHAHVFELEAVDLLDDGGARIGLGGRTAAGCGDRVRGDAGLRQRGTAQQRGGDGKASRRKDLDVMARGLG